MTERRTLPLNRSLLPGTSLAECVLTVVEGSDKGLRLSFTEGRIRVGADPSCELVLSDPAVSGLHAELSILSEGVLLRDLGSTNGTYFLGSKILEALLQPGSVVKLGRTLLAVLPPRDPEPQPFGETSYGPLLGESVRMRGLFALLHRVERTEATILLEGETGTGKSLIAETIHARSPRAGQPFVTVDCGAVAPTLLHSELFGHKRGAFTGAIEDRAGAFESAHTGTLFLDEIGELPLELQPVLLRVLERGEVQRVGDSRTRPVDLRFIAATNRRLEERVAQGTFRPDLFYRLGVVRIGVPSLRECIEDILPLSRRFLGEEKALPADLAALLQSYEWPGNIRQLRNMMERFKAVGSFQLEDEAPRTAELSFHEAKALMIDRFERSYLAALMSEHRGNLSSASRVCGMARNHLRKLLKRHDIPIEEYRRS
jgi:DNA-binding NtrC family response regulator